MGQLGQKKGGLHVHDKSPHDFYPPSTTLKGDIETVTVRPSVCWSVRPSLRPPVRSSHSHNFLPSLHNFYSMFISLKHFIICSFIKKFQKLLPWQPFFFLNFNAYLAMFLPNMKA